MCLTNVFGNQKDQCYIGAMCNLELGASSVVAMLADRIKLCKMVKTKANHKQPEQDLSKVGEMAAMR